MPLTEVIAAIFDLIFSDIQLMDAVCFNIFERVTIECPIIFCTAYDEYAIKSFETSSIDYLLKPIDKRKLERALLKLEKINAMFSKPANAYVDLGKLIQELLPNNNRTLLIHHKETIIPVSYSDVAWFHYDQAVVTVKLISGQSYHISQGIDQIAAGADARLFYRANRQFLVNRHEIHTVEKFFARKLVIKMKTANPRNIDRKQSQGQRLFKMAAERGMKVFE